MAWDRKDFVVGELVGKTMVKATSDHKTVKLLADDGTEYAFCHADEDFADATVTVDDICGNLADLVGSPILKAEVRTKDGSSDKCWSGTWTFYTFATVKGYVDIKWFGTSSGNYSEEVDHVKDSPPFPIRKGVSDRLDEMSAPVVFMTDTDVEYYVEKGAVDIENRVVVKHGRLKATVGTMVVDGVTLPVISNWWVRETIIADLTKFRVTCEVDTAVFGKEDTIGKRCRSYTLDPGELSFKLSDFGIKELSWQSASMFHINRAHLLLCRAAGSLGTEKDYMAKFRPIRVEEPKKEKPRFLLGFDPRED